MPIIPKVGRKAPYIRLLIAALYVTLALGAVTMVYPFLLMLATSVTSSTDTNEFRVVPRYLYDDRALFGKYADDKYSGDMDAVNARYRADFRKPESLAPPRGSDAAGGQALVREWRAFERTLPLSFKETGFRGYGAHPSQLALAYRDHVRRLFGGNIGALNRAYVEENDNFETVMPPLERPTRRNWTPDASRKMQDFVAWKAGLSSEMVRVVSVDAVSSHNLKEDVDAYGGDLRKANRVWPALRGFDQAPLSPYPPADPAQRRDWERFVREQLPFRYLAVPADAAGPYRAFLRSRYGPVGRLNEAYGTRYRAYDEVPVPRTLPEGGAIVIDWGDFVRRPLPTAMLRLDTPENGFRRWLLRRHGLEATPAAMPLTPGHDGVRTAAALQPLNAAYGLSADTILGVSPPYAAADVAFVREHAGAVRRDFVTRNYRLVLDYILLHGRALLVTVVFCAAVVLTTLIVNPLCAYALSRYSLPYAYKVLLFVLATMAFPAEVAMIPNFLLLKQLGMLNTYWALILPGMASGFSIFLLKGFFDSLPKEIYEAGTIDGASDTRMFFNVTLPLSKPIFAVIALQAFTAAYGAFMFALLVCQDPKMWTLMVWLYELQITNPQYVMMAALTVAALPTLLVFVFAQNVIMRGIILPSYK